MNALSLFDGISCGQLALQRAGIRVDKYFASEINKYAIQVTQENFPDTIQLGDVTKWRTWGLPKIDLLLGGSPCQGFSFAGKQLNFDDPRSKLFFEFVKVLKEVKPKYFLLENVKMKQEYQDVISDELGVQPIEINSSLVSAQNRIRLYWTNIPVSCKPIDKEVYLKDILQYTKDWNKATIVGRRLDKNGHRQDYDKSICITQCLEVRQSNTNKSNCLTTVAKDNVLTPLSLGRYTNAFTSEYKFRYYTPIECERLQTIPDNYTGGLSDNQRYKCLGNGWTVDVIAHILGGITGETLCSKSNI